MLNTKEFSRLISLTLIRDQQYYYHAYQLKQLLEEKYEIKKEVIYPILRQLQSEELIITKDIALENSSKIQKKFKITQKGIDEIKYWLEQIDFQIQELKNIKNIVEGTNNHETMN